LNHFFPGKLEGTFAYRVLSEVTSCTDKRRLQLSNPVKARKVALTLHVYRDYTQLQRLVNLAKRLQFNVQLLPQAGGFRIFKCALVHS